MTTQKKRQAKPRAEARRTAARPTPRIQRSTQLEFSESTGERSLDQLDMTFTVRVHLGEQSAMAHYQVRAGDDHNCPLTLNAYGSATEAWNLTPSCLFLTPDEVAEKARAFVAAGIAMEQIAALLAERKPALDEQVQRLRRVVHEIIVGSYEEDDR